MSTTYLRNGLLLALSIAGATIATEAFAADAPSGKALYTERCGMCHQTIGMAVGILSRRPGDASKGLLEQREDLSAAFVNAAVRAGINNMPRISRGEVSDPELAQIAGRIRPAHPGATVLSAGMSGDVEQSINYGATQVRLGSAVLGNR